MSTIIIDPMGNIVTEQNESTIELQIERKALDLLCKYDIKNLGECQDLFADRIDQTIKVKNDKQDEEPNFIRNVKSFYNKDIQRIYVDFKHLSINDIVINLKYYDYEAMALRYTLNTYPLTNIHTVTSAASTLINTAKMEIDNVKLDDILLASGSKYFLFGNVKNIVVINDVDGTTNIGIETLIIDGLNSYCGFEYPYDEETAPMEYRSLVDKAIKYVKTFQALQNCDKTPIEIKRDFKDVKYTKQGVSRTRGIIKKYVSLTKKYKDIQRSYKDSQPMDKDGKTLTLVSVSGFIRNQPYGKGRTQYKTIWIDGFTRGQWVKSGLNYITVKE